MKTWISRGARSRSDGLSFLIVFEITGWNNLIQFSLDTDKFIFVQDEHIIVPEEDSPSFESVSSGDERQNMFQRQQSSTDSTSSVKKRGKNNRSLLGRLSRKSQKNINQSISVSDSDINTTTDEEKKEDEMSDKHRDKKIDMERDNKKEKKRGKKRDQEGGQYLYGIC